MGMTGLEWLAGGHRPRRSRESAKRETSSRVAETAIVRAVPSTAAKISAAPSPPPIPVPLMTIVPATIPTRTQQVSNPTMANEYVRIKVVQKVDHGDSSLSETSTIEPSTDETSVESSSEDCTERNKKKKQSAKQKQMQKLLQTAAKLADCSDDDHQPRDISSQHKHKKTLKIRVESSEEESSDDDLTCRRKEKRRLSKARRAEVVAAKSAKTTLEAVLRDVLNAKIIESSDQEKKKVQWQDLEKAEFERLQKKYGGQEDEKKTSAVVNPRLIASRQPKDQGSKFANISNNQKHASNNIISSRSTLPLPKQTPPPKKQIDHPPTSIQPSLKQQQQHYSDFIQKTTMTRLIRASESMVVIREDVIENPSCDPRPNAFFDAKAGILRVYHGPAWGNTTGHLTPTPVSNFPIGNYVDPYTSGTGHMGVGPMNMGMPMHGGMSMPMYAPQATYNPYMGMPGAHFGPNGTPPFGFPLPNGYVPPAWPYGGVLNGAGIAQTVHGGSEKGSNDSASPAHKSSEPNSNVNGWGRHSGSPQSANNQSNMPDAWRGSDGSPTAKKSALKTQTHTNGAKSPAEVVTETKEFDATNGWGSIPAETDEIPSGWGSSTAIDETGKVSENTTQTETTWVDGGNDHKVKKVTVSKWSKSNNIDEPTTNTPSSWSATDASTNTSSADTSSGWPVVDDKEGSTWPAADDDSAWSAPTDNANEPIVGTSWDAPLPTGWGNPDAASSTSGWTEADKQSAEVAEIPINGW